MKNLLKFSFLFILAAFTLTACGDDSNEPSNPAQEGNVHFLGAYSYGDGFSNGGEVFEFALYTDGIDFSGEAPTGSGDYVVLMVNSENMGNGSAKNGVYEITNTGAVGTGMVAFTQDNNLFGSYVYIVEDGEATGLKAAKSGTITIENNKITAELVYTDDATDTYTYVGAISYEDDSQSSPAKAMKAFPIIK